MFKAVISGYYGFKNFGDEAILSVLTEHLKSLNTDIVVFSSDTEYTQSTNKVRAVNTFDIKSVIKGVKDCDVFISGGGSLLQDTTSFKSLVYYIFVLSLAILFNKKIIIFAQGIGPLNKKISKVFVKNILKLCTYVSVRDEQSLELLKSWNIDADLVCDPVFSLKTVYKDKKPIVGVQLRNCKDMNINLLQKLAMLINTKFSDKKIEILSLQENIDYELCKRFEEVLNNINPDIKTEIVDTNIKEHIEELEYLFAMRYHAILYALKSGVKTCAINYDVKVENLAKDADIPIISVKADDNFEKIFNKTYNLETDKLLQYTNSKRFDWSMFDKCFNA